MSLKVFQEKIGLTPDGIFGKNTFKEGSKYLGIKSHSNAVHFWAQIAHETMEFKVFEENLNYGSTGLKNVFGKYFDSESAFLYARKPEKIANLVYANRMGNGDEYSGDGWKFRGRGALQLTGKDNYNSFANYIKNPCILECPDVVINHYCFDSAKFFFDVNDLWYICSEGINDNAINKLTKKINGGYNGLEHRKLLTLKYSHYSI